MLTCSMEDTTMTAPITTSEAARLLRVSEASVRQLERNGRLAATRTGTGMRLFIRSDVERLALERAQRPGR
jgi:excisionase family DNA binding protein